MLQQADTQALDDAASANEYSIGDLAARYGVSLRTLRFYEERGLLRPARRGGQRVFSDKDRTRLELVMLAKRLGFSLAEVWNLVQSRTSEPEDAHGAPPSVASLGLSKQQISGQVEHLTRERESVQRAIEELRATAARGGSLASS